MFAEPTYQFEPELRSWLERPARVKEEAASGLRAMICFTLAVVGIIGGFACHDLGELFTLQAHGRAGQAIITNRRKVEGKAYSYYLSYALTTEKGWIEEEAQVSEPLYEQKHNGDAIFVSYLPQSPQVHRLGLVTAERVHNRTAAWALGLLACAGLLGSIITITAHEYSKELRLVREGVLAQGLISDCVPPQPNSKFTDYQVTYRFTLPSGEQIKTCSVAGLVGKQLSAGQIVTVLYNAANPRHSRLYCALRYAEVSHTDITPA